MNWNAVFAEYQNIRHRKIHTRLFHIVRATVGFAVMYLFWRRLSLLEYWPDYLMNNFWVQLAIGALFLIVVFDAVVQMRRASRPSGRDEVQLTSAQRAADNIAAVGSAIIVTVLFSVY